MGRKNMKNISFLLAFITGLILFHNNIMFSQCPSGTTIIDKCKTSITNPYIYDGYWMSKFTFDDKAKKIEGHFVAFEGEKYQILFCSSGFEEVTTVCIYHRSSRADKTRIKVYDSSKNTSNSFWTFEPPKSGDYYIEYTIPPSKDGKPKDASVLILIFFVQSGTIKSTKNNNSPCFSSSAFKAACSFV